MGEKLEGKKRKKNKEGTAEKGARFYRDFNMFVGGVALVGTAVVAPPLAAPLGVYAGFNFLQAVGGEGVRRYAKKRRLKKEKDKK